MTAPRGVTLERVAVAVAFAVYLAFQLHANAFHGYWGQDWIGHKYNVLRAAEKPWEFFAYYTSDRTNGPLYHILAGVVKRLAGTRRYLVIIGLMNVALGIAGACFAYAVVRRLIASPILRVAAVVFVLFVPFAMIHAQVMAADAAATPLFWLLLWLLLRFRPDAPPGRFALSVGSLAVLLVVAVLTRFTFGSFILATGVWAALLGWTRLLSGLRLAIVLLLVTVVPLLFAYGESVRFRALKDPYGITVPTRLADAAMNPRSITWLRPADTDVLQAPSYTWKRNGAYDLLVSNKHSFPALLHLGMFTDILNIYQFDPYDHYFGQRTQQNHRRMQVAVRGGVAFSAFAAIAVAVLTIRCAHGVLRRRDPADVPLLAVLVFCLAWFGNVVVMYPLLPGAYFEGTWLPRLMAPPLIGFFIAGFVLLDRLPWKSPAWHGAVLAAVVAQSLVHASFLWPHPSDQDVYEPNGDVAGAAATAGAVFRVLSWQDGYQTNHRGYYCLEKDLGIVVNRPDDARGTESWRLGFTVAPGPSSPTVRGTLRVWSRDSSAVDVDFEGMSNVETPIVLAAGRNEVRVQLVSPPAVETRKDVLVCMARISAIAMVGPDGTSAMRLLP